MPKVKANQLTMNYETQGEGEPLILIPYLSAEHACYAFQVADYAKHYTCISLDLRGTGETDKPDGAYSTELLADDVAARSVWLDEATGALAGAAPGTWLIESSTASVGWIKELAAAAKKRECELLDAPVTGSPLVA